MKCFIVILLLAVCCSQGFGKAETTTDNRLPRFFNGWLDSLLPRCTGCPRHCLRDVAVFKGYCCGCARVSDKMPFDCPNNPACPVDGRKLCRDYDYMMDCCCP